MLIPCREIAEIMETALKADVSKLNKKITLVAYLLGESPEQLSFVKIKKRLAERMGINFDFTHIANPPAFDAFLKMLSDKLSQPESTGVIIQHPLPEGYDKDKLYTSIPFLKDIEGHNADSPFQFPLSLAVLTGLKYIFVCHPEFISGSLVPKMLKHVQHDRQITNDIMVDFENDKPFFQQKLMGKKIVIAGRGSTGGKPIGESLDEIGISYQTVHSQTENPEQFYKEADIIITATGKKIITSEMIKKNVVLLNVGLRKEDGKLRGDYDEEEIDDTAAFYTQTPGGLGPLDVLYLYKNLIDSAKLQ